jgi:hypothetical protein
VIEQQVTVGSVVQVGDPAPFDRKVTWKVLRIDRAAEGVVYATITSGLTGLTRTYPIERLTLARLKETA